jgi:hypothetical protein
MDDRNPPGPHDGKSDRELVEEVLERLNAIIENRKKSRRARERERKLERERERKHKEDQEYMRDIVRWTGEGGYDPNNRE